MKTERPAKMIELKKNEDGLLERSSERELLNLYHDEKASEKDRNHAAEVLVKSNQRLVLSVANKFKNRGVEVEDLVQEGLKGLFHTLEAFDVKKNVKFATYATYWVRQSIIRYLKSQSKNVRLPEYVVNYGWAINKFKREFLQEKGVEPTVIDIAKQFKQNAAFIKRIQKALISETSLNAKTNDDGKAEVGDLLPGSSTAKQVDDVAAHELKHALKHIISQLPFEDRLVLDYRYGIGNVFSIAQK